MGVWPEAMGGCWPPIEPQPETPHEAAIADRVSRDEEPAQVRRRNRKSTADD
jgi:hypothetical protein